MYGYDKNNKDEDKKKDFFSNILGNWKDGRKKSKTDTQKDKKGVEDALAKLSTLDEKSQAIRKKTIGRFVKVMLFLSFGMFILTGLVKVYFILSKGETRKPVTTKVQDVKLQINSFTKWQEIKDQQVVSIRKNIKDVDSNLTKKINNVKNELKQDISNSSITIVKKIDENQKQNTQFVNSLLNDIKKEITASEKKIRNYTDKKSLTIEEKIKKIKKEELVHLAKTKNKLDFSKLSLPTLPGSSNSSRKGNTVNRQSSYIKPNKIEETVEVEEQIIAPKISKVSTLPIVDKNKNKNKIPTFTIMPGFTKGTIITGADVPTLAKGKNSPKPVWISITGDTLIANNDSLDVDECMLQASATGDFASGVAEIRLSRISCSATDKDGKKYKILARIKGWVYGESGKYGLKGRIVGKEGKIIEKAIPLTLLQGAITALSNIGSSGTTLVPGLGGGGTSGTGGAATSSMGNSAGKVLGKFSDYYLKILESLNPIIEIKAGREVVIAFQGGEKLKLEKYTPTNINYFEDKGDNQK